ncbi:MAG: hypothetical protein GWN29_12215 [Gammaproteobacteria bacterium]|nr:hypothetical protein [Gammaproteobacteria bacterium]
MNDLAKNVILWIVIAVVLLSVFQSFRPDAAAGRDGAVFELPRLCPGRLG